MSHKDIHAAQDTPEKGNPDDTPKPEPGPENPDTEPEKEPAKVAPGAKS